MSQLCSQCSRVNPPDASYCYHDGALLAGHSKTGPSVNPGAKPFPNPFVFPSGQSCRNFDQLAMTCQQNWKAAVDLLRQGFFAGFLGGIGRADLAQAAKEATSFPDHDRGLDQLLAKFPTDVLDPPKLQVEPTRVNLGEMEIGTDRTLELQLTNTGMRLLYGSVVSDCKWITLGEAPGNPQRVFQFRDESTLQVQIRGQHLRAGSKPLEGNLVVESSGGSATIAVSVNVPVKPYPDGALQGAVTPRQIAEKAKAKPKEAAPLFQNGNVAQWFTNNGWTYPVQGPNAAGLGAVQQFFEALGLARAPKLQIKPGHLQLQGRVGQSLETTLHVSSDEKRPVYAYAKCDVPWLDVSKFKLNGRFATIFVSVPHVPDRAGETLQANITVTGNGNQQFKVGLLLSVTGGNPFAGIGDSVPTISLPPGSVPPLPPPARGSQPAAIPVAPRPTATNPPPSAVPPSSVHDLPPVPSAVPAVPVSAPPTASQTVAGKPPDQADTIQSSRPSFPPTAGSPFQAPATPDSLDFSSPGSVINRPSVRSRTALGAAHKKPLWMHLAPLALLAVALIGVLARDWMIDSGSPTDIDLANPKIALSFDPKMRFGLVKIQPRGRSGKAKSKDRELDILLSYWVNGASNDFSLRIDDKRHMFGEDGVWLDPRNPRRDSNSPIAHSLGYMPNGQEELGGKSCMFSFKSSLIRVKQDVQIIPGELVEDIKTGQFKRLLDTCLVQYTITNNDKQPHKVGMRFILDSYINDNDGVPFIIPGKSEMIDTFADFKDDIPSFFQAIEKPNLKNPGLIVRLNLKIGSKYEQPSRVSLTHWPDVKKVQQRLWDIPVKSIQKPSPDSAIVMYWPDNILKPKSKRVIGFTYGLGGVAGKEKLGLIFPNRSFAPREEIEIVALIVDPEKGQTVTLKVPDEFEMVQGSKTQEVPAAKKSKSGTAPRSQVTWRIRALSEGTFPIELESSRGEKTSRPIRISVRGIF